MASHTLRNLCHFPSPTPQPSPAEAKFTPGEAQRMVRLVGVELLKRRLRDSPDEVVGHGEFLDACVEAGAARTRGQAEELAQAMDQSGSVVLFRGMVYLHPEKVVDLVRSVVPPVLEIENDVRKEEFELLKKKKEEIDRQAHKQVKRILWSGLLFLQTTLGLTFRFTFWELSWDVIAPLAFFVTSSDLLVGYAYFLVTLRKLSYRSYMERLFETRRRKLYDKEGFDMEKYLEMEKQIKCPLGGECTEGCKLHESGLVTPENFSVVTYTLEIERRMQDGQDEMVSHGQLLNALLESSLKRTEAEALVQKMDDISLVMLVRGKTYLNHEKVVDLIRRAVPFALAPENDARKEEFKQLQAKMEEINSLAHKHAMRILCVGFAYFLLQFALLFRLTFWEFTWHETEPLDLTIAGIQLIICYGYFLHTSSNPTLQDFRQRLFLARRRKLCAKHRFDIDRYLKLQKHL
ncbi:calcium uniporter protein 6, mitochondrial-like [Lolium rigidum]|uniref:calcium uniporter protein 6, mitochondrial-like n=1 Tax=Lolium rigidum TaxID=89674 RepID=UPI001F5DC1D4|nr:calcium uniporter protein 6, mitochondrial-like [Lolium rigidum]